MRDFLKILEKKKETVKVKRGSEGNGGFWREKGFWEGDFERKRIKKKDSKRKENERDSCKKIGIS